jgi:hypothetical protein
MVAVSCGGYDGAGNDRGNLDGDKGTRGRIVLLDRNELIRDTRKQMQEMPALGRRKGSGAGCQRAAGGKVVEKAGARGSRRLPRGAEVRVWRS